MCGDIIEEEGLGGGGGKADKGGCGCGFYVGLGLWLLRNVYNIREQREREDKKRAAGSRLLFFILPYDKRICI